MTCIVFFCLRGSLWRRVLPDCWWWGRPSVQLPLSLPPNQQGVILSPATLTCLINPSDFPILIPSVEAEAPSPPYLVRNTASFQPLTCRGSKPVQPEKEDRKWDEEEEQGDLMIVMILMMMMHQSRSILLTWLAVWVGREEENLLQKCVRGIVFAEAGQSLLDTVFNQTVFLFLLLFTVLYILCCLFILLLLDLGV